MYIGPSEAETFWTALPRKLARRGLQRPAGHFRRRGDQSRRRKYTAYQAA